MNELDGRRFVLIGIMLIVTLVFLFRLLYIQVIDDSYLLSANNQALRYTRIYPLRGLIEDRNKNIMVYNEMAFDLMVTPREVGELDTAAFCQLIGIEKATFLSKMKKATSYSRYKPSVFEKQITAAQYAGMADQLYQYPGFFTRRRTLRHYPYASAAHVLGYLGEINARQLRDTIKINADDYYELGDYIGMSGVEARFERDLRGEPGMHIIMVDVHNRVKGMYKNGARNVESVRGKPIQTTLDAALQQYGEQLMQKKKGSIVAIEPKTGEILALVTAPAYDPNVLSGRQRTQNYAALRANDTLDPLFNRALQATYPPGSIFKLIQSLIALEEGVIHPQTGFACNKQLIGCHDHPMAYNIQRAIQFSCNPYYYHTFKRIINQRKSRSIFEDSHIGLENWHRHVSSFGLGKVSTDDLVGGKLGRIPNSAYYDKLYGNKRWAFSTIYSLSIGQGELGIVPVQMANLAATIANRGYFIVPHVVRSIGDSASVSRTKEYTTISSQHFEPIIEGMQQVVEGNRGTARRAAIEGIKVCGKTGTVENPHGKDHSVFIAFAPKDNPKIAISVFIENAGFGGTWAAPVASLMIEKYLRQSINQLEKEERILAADFIADEG